jgi:type IV pilus assembly PilO-like protein
VKTTDQKQLLIVGGCALAVLVILAGGYFMMISPKRAKAATLDRQVGETRAAIALAKATSQNPKNHDPRDLFRINKAMPDRVDMPGAILDLAAVGRATGVAIDGVQPFDPTPASSAGYESVPVTVTVAGKYGQITNFLAGLQHLVVLRHGQFRDARGRLFGVDAINFAAGDAGYPQIKATLKLETYVYAPAAPAPTDTTTTTTTAQPDNLSAAGGTG